MTWIKELIAKWHTYIDDASSQFTTEAEQNTARVTEALLIVALEVRLLSTELRRQREKHK